MPTGSDLNDHITSAYDAVMRDGTVPALGREAIKDVRSTFMEVFFGKGERGSEPGTPLNPLFHDIVASRKSHSEKGSTMSPMPTPSQIIANPQAYQPQQQGQEQGNANAVEAAAPVRGDDAGATPTPSQIIANPQAYLPEQSQGGQQQEHGREM